MTVHPPEAITVRPLTEHDFGLIQRWLAADHVRQWWPDEPTTVEGVAEKYDPRLAANSQTRVFIINVEGRPAGLIQCYRHADSPEWDRAVGVPDAVGIDYLIGEPDLCGRGIGTAAIRSFTGMVFDLYPDIATVVAVPQRDNRASCRALEKAGFWFVREADIESDDPSDAGISAIYVMPRPA